MLENTTSLFFITLIAAILLILVLMINVRRKILLERLNGRNISKKNWAYRLIANLFISHLPD